MSLPDYLLQKVGTYQESVIVVYVNDVNLQKHCSLQSIMCPFCEPWFSEFRANDLIFDEV
jgi:hypothetical protein